MHGLIDLHCHWIAGIDDGAKSPEAGLAMLTGLHALGFATVMATPHMRPGMFDNERGALEHAFFAMHSHLQAETRPLPRIGLASEHFFDETVFLRLKRGEGLPYPEAALPDLGDSAQRIAVAGTRRKRVSALVEFPEQFPVRVADRFLDLMGIGIRPVLAHPERYKPVWKDDSCLDPLLEVGAVLLLDVCALVGKYGSAAEKAAHKLLEEDAYEAACTDAHRPEDVDGVAKALQRLETLVGAEECRRLFCEGPRAIVQG
jgi:protein-tyrosine phosphatase